MTCSGYTVCIELLKAGRRKPVRAASAPPILSEMRGNLSSETELSSYWTYSTKVPFGEPHEADGAFVTSSVRN